MNHLSPDAREVLESVRDAHDPTATDRDRVRAALARRMAVPATLAAGRALASPPASVAKLSVMKALASVVVIGSVTSASVYALRDERPHTAPIAAATRELSPVAASAINLRANDIARPIAPVPSTPTASVDRREADNEPRTLPTRTRESLSTRPRATAAPTASASEPVAPPPPVSDATAVNHTLGEELALVHAARDALRNHEAATALERLDQHAARYPDGVLREERNAARVLALCALGRIDEARTLATRFLAEAPGSPHAARVRASCIRD